MSPDNHQRKRQWRRWVWSGLAMLIVFGLGFATLHNINWLEVRQTVQQADLAWVGVAWVTILVGQWLRLWRAWRLMQHSGAVAWSDVARATLGAQVINWLSPLRVGDVWRVWQLRVYSQPVPSDSIPSNTSKVSKRLFRSALAILVEKSLDSLGLAVLALTLLILPTPNNANGNWVRLAMTACGAALLLSALLILRPGMLKQQLMRRFPQLADWGLRWSETLAQDTLFPRRDIALSSLVTGLMWLLATLTNVALAQAFHIAWQGWMIPLLVVSIQTVSIVSPVPGNVGVIPLVTVGVLALAGLPAALGIAHGTLHYVLVYGTNLLWFVLLQLRQTVQRRDFRTGVQN